MVSKKYKSSLLTFRFKYTMQKKKLEIKNFEILARHQWKLSNKLFKLPYQKNLCIEFSFEIYRLWVRTGKCIRIFCPTSAGLLKKKKRKTLSFSTFYILPLKTSQLQQALWHFDGWVTRAQVQNPKRHIELPYPNLIT